MPTVPESPRRSSTAGGNPVTNDPKLLVLLERLDLVDSYDKFQNWKSEFLDRFEFFLGEEGSAKATDAYETFRRERMEKVVKKVDRLSEYREKGDLSTDRVSVRARNAMNEVSVVLLDAVKDVRGLVPPTSADEDKAGYTKYNLGAVLVKDGFQEYERLQKCKDIMDKMREECVQAIGDEKLLEAIRKYDDEVNRFVSIMEDLGLYKIMLKGREFDPSTSQRDKAPKTEEEPEEEPPARLIPELPFVDEDEVQEEETTTNGELEEPPLELMESPSADTPQKRRSSRRKYVVGGSWGSMPMDFGSSSSSSLKVKQDLADGAGKPPTSPSKKSRQPDQVFVTPARQPRPKVANITEGPHAAPLDVHSPKKDDSDGGNVGATEENEAADNSEMRVGENKVNGDEQTNDSKNLNGDHPVDDDAGSVADGSVSGSVGGMSFTSATSRVLETDTPRTRKAKLDWKAVQSSRGKQEAIKDKSKPKTPKKDRNSVSKPPRPSTTKELTTKTENSGWTLPMDEDADGSSVWSKPKPATPLTSSDAPIGPGIKVRRVSRTGQEPGSPVEGEETRVVVEKHEVSTAESAAPEVTQVTTTTELPGDTHTSTTTHLHHNTNTVVHHHHNNVEERHIYNTQHRTIVHETDHLGSQVLNNTRVIHVIHRPGIEWIGTVPVISTEEEVVHTTGYIVTGKVRRSSHIRMITFCSIDDSIDPRLLGIVAQCYPLVEFAVLMRQDMAGQPRYASPDYIQRLARVQAKTGGQMNLAAHLCGAFVEEILNGDDSILGRLEDMKFKRVQINATSPYGVNTHNIGKHVEPFIEIANKHPDLEISVQANEENLSFWQGIVDAGPPQNVTFLYDSSMGRGEVPEKWPQAPSGYRVGYAGGIGLGGRSMTKSVLNQILMVGNHQAIWVSMESSMRCTKNGKDVFDLEKCYQIIDVAHELKIHLHPSFVH